MPSVAIPLATQPDVAMALEKRREHMSKRGREFKLRPPPILDPRAHERAYQAFLQEKLTRLFELIDISLFRNLDSILRRGQTEMGVRQDDYLDDFRAIINGIQIDFGRELSEDELRQTARQRASDVSEFNKGQNDKVFKTVLNVDVFRSEPWLEPQIDAFAEQNVTLIKSLENDTLKDIQTHVMRAVRTGSSIKGLETTLRERFGIARRRANLIARDQIGKLNGQLTMLRQTDLGVTKYKWRTALDRRVRGNPSGAFPHASPSHWHREGKTYSWDKAPSDGHPGEPINCRCYAEPILEDLI